MVPKKYKPKPVVQQPNDTSDQLVYFRLRRPLHYQQPSQQLIVNRNPRKRNAKLQSTKQPTPQTIQQQQIQIQDMFSKMKINNSVQFFLKRVDSNITYKNQAQKLTNQELLPKCRQLSQEIRSQNRQRILDKRRGFEQEKNKKVKIVDLDEKNQFVQFNNKKVEVQNLADMSQYYYVLQKRDTVKQGPQVMIPQQAEYLLDKVEYEQHMTDEEPDPDADSEDSNRESNPEFDYPDQDFEEADSDDEGVINKQYYIGSEEEYEKDSNEDEIDPEQHYRRYLQRCKKMDDDDDD